MNNLLHINTKNIIFAILLFIIVVLFSILFYLEIRMLDRIIIPFLVTFLISLVLYYVFNKIFKDKFVSKIFLISILLHFIFILFWQLLKYYGLGLQMPTENLFEAYICDRDGVLYHELGNEVRDYLSGNHLGIFKKKMYGRLFPKIIGTIYYITGTHNPFLVCCFNSLVAGSIAPIIYSIGKSVLRNIQMAKIYSFLFVIAFSHIMYTSTMMRDVYITLFIYLSIFLAYKFYKTRNIIFLITTLLNLFFLNNFRPYACYIVFIAIITSYIINNIKIVKQNSKLKVNKITFALIILSPALLVLLYIIILKLTHTFGVISSAEDLINIRESVYTGRSESDYVFDFSELYSIFPPLAIFLGMVCMFFAPFPWEWFMAKRIMYVPDMLIFYCFLSSFFKNLKLVFIEKNYILITFLIIIIIQFSVYCITVGNSGTVHRLRGPFIPMIYLIAMYRPDKFLNKILNKIKSWRIV